MIYRKFYLPLLIFNLYILTTFLLSIYGPIKFQNYDVLITAIFLFNFLLIFSIGYISGIVTFKRPKNYRNFFNINTFLSILKILIIITFFIKLIELIDMLMNPNSNLSITSLGNAYVNTYKDYVRGSGNYSLMFIIKIITYLPFLFSIILGIYYFNKLPLKYKVMIIFIFISMIIVETIGHGKQKQLGDIIIFILTILILKYSGLDKKKKKVLFFYILLFVIMGICFLIFVLKMRYDALGIDTSNINEKVHFLLTYDLDNIIFDIFGDAWGFPIAVFTGYLTGGYYGLSLCLNIPFVWTYFVGNSYSLTMLLVKFFNLPLNIEDSYPYRVGEVTGWDQTKWHSLFPWLASDFTFLGSLILFLFIAFIYAKVCIESFYYSNPLSIMLFAIMNLGLVYVPANNQLFHTPEGVMSTTIMFFIWFIYHRKFNVQVNR